MDESNDQTQTSPAAMADWRGGVLSAVTAWADAEGGRSKPGSRQIGLARRDSEGWYVVDMRNQAFNIDQLETLRLCDEDGPGKGSTYRVIEVMQERESLRMRIGAHVDADSLRLSGPPRNYSDGI